MVVIGEDGGATATLCGSSCRVVQEDGTVETRPALEQLEAQPRQGPVVAEHEASFTATVREPCNEWMSLPGLGPASPSRLTHKPSIHGTQPLCYPLNLFPPVSRFLSLLTGVWVDVDEVAVEAGPSGVVLVTFSRARPEYVPRRTCFEGPARTLPLPQFLAVHVQVFPV